MPSPLTDAAYAERLLRSSLGGEPVLTEAQIADLMVLATSTNVDTATSEYTEANLNRAASLGWQWKASITAGEYDMGGGAGKTLEFSQWHAHCMSMAASYATGAFSVLGSPNAAGTTRKSGIGMITLGSSFTEVI